MWAKHKQSGFTIVELLIVIVVIAILAAITIVAFNGIQSRAKNQQTVAAVRAYYTALKAYAVDTGALPTSTGCLGVSSFYDSNPCYIGANTYNYNSALNNALLPYMNNNQPSLPTGRIVSGSNSSSGIFYYPSGSYIAFPMFASSTCPTIAGSTLDSSVAFGSDIFCRIKFPEV